MSNWTDQQEREWQAREKKYREREDNMTLKEKKEEVKKEERSCDTCVNYSYHCTLSKEGKFNCMGKENYKLWQPKPAEQEVDWLNLGNALHKNLTQEQHRAIDQFINLVKQLWEREK